MIDPSPSVFCDLNYGHFGAPTYNLDNSSWTFTRDPRRREISFLTPWSTISHAAIRHTTPNLWRTAKTIHISARQLARDYAHLAPASEYLSELEAVSAATIYVSRSYDATFGRLLSFGSITCRGHWDHRRKQIMAIATGEAGNVLRLQLLDRIYYGSEDGVCLEGPLLAQGEQAFWNEDAAPIRQICFAKGEDDRTFLAVRLPRRTVLFHPTYVHNPRAPELSRYFDLPPTAIDACPIYTISKGATGGAPHADVAFNPEYQRQFAIVDERGQWSIWDIDGGFRMNNYSISCSIPASSTSQLAGNTNLQAQPGGSVGDGWARIFWCGDANTVVIANRLCVVVVDIKGSLTTLNSPDFLSARSADWILDVQKHPGSHSHFFVLTSTRLFFVGVTSLNDDSNLMQTDIGAAILFSWTHFRGEEDITLQLSIHAPSDEECSILIHSRLNKLVTSYTVGGANSIIGSRWAASGPASFTVDIGDGAHHVIQLHQENLKYKGSGPEGDGKRLSDQDHADQFFQLTALMSDLSIHQTVFSTTPTEGVNTSPIGPISWSKTRKRKQCHQSNRFDDLTVDTDFVVPDGQASISEPLLKCPQQQPSRLGRKPVSVIHVFDFRLLYESLLEATIPPTSTVGAAPESVDVSVVIREVERLVLDGSGPAEPPLGTLLEFAGMEITVSDVDESSTMVLESFSSQRPQQTLLLQSIANGYVLGISDSFSANPPTIASIYDGILQNWIAPLPSDIAPYVRQRKERIARRMAAETLLAASWLRPNTSSPYSQTDPQPFHSQDSTVALPIPTPRQTHPDPLSSQPSSSLPSSYRDATSQSIPTSAPPDPLTRLSKNLRIERASSSPISSNISRLLSHWHPGTDPKTYRWHPTDDGGLESATEEDDDESSHEQRAKAKRRKARRERRQQREDQRLHATAISRALPILSSPGPAYAAGAGGLGMSSQVLTTSQSESQGLGLVVQSQVEPGRHGGRLLLKKKKGRKRVGGF